MNGLFPIFMNELDERTLKAIDGEVAAEKKKAAELEAKGKAADEAKAKK